jgi:hypothetical protein
VTDTGAKVQGPVSVPGQGQVVADVPAPRTGSWLSESVTLTGGGVAVSQVVHGAAGWAEAPCQSSTAQQWYFANGVTTGSNAMFIALFNPTSTPDVVDVSFVTPKGVVHPINFQGIVVQADQTQVEPVSPFVQDQTNVATTVVTRTGRLVAGELQLFSGSTTGMALVPGSPRAQQEWAVPQSQELAGGASALDVFNPGPTTQEVTVQARLGSGPLAPFRSRVGPDTTWVLSTGAQTRIPKNDPYAAVVSARGGSGVVVGRFVAAPGAAPAPQEGLATAVDSLSATADSRRWVVPSPGSAAQPAWPGAAPVHLALTNVSTRRASYVIKVMQRSGLRTIASGSLRPSTSFSLSGATLTRAGLHPLLVTASAALAVSEDVGPSATYGVVTMPGIPLARARPR